MKIHSIRGGNDCACEIINEQAFVLGVVIYLCKRKHVISSIWCLVKYQIFAQLEHIFRDVIIDWDRTSIHDGHIKSSLQNTSMKIKVIIVIIVIIVSLNHPRVKLYMGKKNAFVHIYKPARTRYVRY